MSYRIHLKKLSNENYLNVKNLNSENFDEGLYEKIFDILSPISSNLIEISPLTINQENDKKFFNENILQNIMSQEGGLYLLINKEDLKLIIKETQKLVADYKKTQNDKIVDFFNNKDEELGREVLSELYNENNKKIHELGESELSLKGNYSSLHIEDDFDTLVSSSFYEYELFNLIHIYKTFDWENDKMFLIGG